MNKLITIFYFLSFLLLNGNCFAIDIDTIIKTDNLRQLKEIDLPTIIHSKPTKNKNTVLIESIHKRATQISNFLIQREIGINVKNYLEKTALMIAFQEKMPLAFIEKLLRAGASPILKDRQGRDIIFYARTTRDPNYIKLADKLVKEVQVPAQNEIILLAASIKEQKQSPVIEFYRKYKTLNFNLNGLSDIDYFLDANCFESWGMEFFLERGYELNQKNFLHKAIKLKKHRLAEVLISNHVSLIEVNSQKQNPLMLAIENKSPEHILSQIFQRFIRFDQVDSQGNNLLHYTAKSEACHLIEPLTNNKVSAHRPNLNGITPSMMLINGTCSDTQIKRLLRNNPNPNLRNKQNETIVHSLAKTRPRLLIDNFNELKNQGYNFNAPDKNGNTAIAIIKRQKPDLLNLVNFKDIEEEVVPITEIPDEIEIPETLPSIELDSIQEFKDHSPALSGESKFDLFLEESLNSLIRIHQPAYTQVIAGELNLNVQDTTQIQDLKILQESINRANSELSNKRNKLSELITRHNAQKATYESKLAQKTQAHHDWTSNSKKVRDEIISFNNSFNSLKANMEGINQFRIDFEEFKKSIESKSSPMQIDLNDLEQEAIENKRRHKRTESQIKQDYKIKVDIAALTRNNLEVEVANLKSSRSQKRNRRDSAEEELKRTKQSIRKNYNDINSPSHRHSHDSGKNPDGSYKCGFLHNIHNIYEPKKGKLEKEISHLTSQINVLKNEINRRTDDLNQARREFESELVLIRKDQQSDLSANKDFFEREQNDLNARIENLKVEIDIEIQDVINEFSLRKAQLVSTYGDLDELRSTFLSISSVYQILNRGIDKILEHGLISCTGILSNQILCGIPNDKLFGDKNKANFPFYSHLQQIASSIDDFKRSEVTLKNVNSSINDVALYEDRIITLQIEIADDLEAIEALKNDLSTMDSNSIDTSNPDDIYNLVEKNINFFRSTFTTEHLEPNRTQNQTTSFSDFILKRKIQEQSLHFDLIDFDPYEKYSQRKLSDQESVFLISEILKLAGKNDNNGILSQAAALNSTTYLLTQSGKNSIRIDTSNGSFVINPDGSLIDYDTYKDDNFELLSNDVRFQQKAQSIITKLQSIDKSSLQKEDLDKYELAFAALKEADKFAFQGKTYESQLALSVSDNIADTLLSITPVLSVGKDAYEVLTGKNFITGIKLSTEDWYLAIFSLATAGTFSQFKAIKNILRPIILRLKTNLLSFKTINKGLELIFSARKLGYKTKEQLSKFTEFTKYISRDQTGAIGNLTKRIDDAGDIASNAATRNKLFKQLATESQIAEKGTVIAGKGSNSAFRNAEHAARKYGGHADDYVKKSSSSVVTPDGYKIETHWVENITTGQKYEAKTIMTQPK